MKKILITLAILFQAVFADAQDRDNVGHKVGPWNISSHNCFKGLVWKLRKSYYSDNSEKFTNEIEIKNNYGVPVTFSYNMTENAGETITRYRKTLERNETYISTYCPNVNFVTFYVTDVCFNNTDCRSGCYAQCDKGSPNQPGCGSVNSGASGNNQKAPPATNPAGSAIQTDQKQSVAVSAGRPVTNQQNNTNTEILNQLEATTTQVTNALTNSMKKSAAVSDANSNELRATQEEFAENSLTDKQVDSLLANPDPANYAAIHVYNGIKQNIKWYVSINGKKLAPLNKHENNAEYRIYSGNKLVVQVYPIGSLGSTLPVQSVTMRIRKGKAYYFIIKKAGMMNFSLEQIDEEPLDKKGNKLYQSINQKVKSDIDY